MKLRINGNSLRFRLSRPELARFQATGRIEESILFAATPGSYLTYALESAPQPAAVKLRYKSNEVTVILSEEQARIWGEEGQVGVYASVDIGPAGSLDVAVEKDFACLDRSDVDNHDTFPNPNAGAVCG